MRAFYERDLFSITVTPVFLKQLEEVYYRNMKNSRHDVVNEQLTEPIKPKEPVKPKEPIKPPVKNEAQILQRDKEDELRQKYQDEKLDEIVSKLKSLERFQRPPPTEFCGVERDKLYQCLTANKGNPLECRDLSTLLKQCQEKILASPSSSS